MSAVAFDSIGKRDGTGDFECDENFVDFESQKGGSREVWSLVRCKVIVVTGYENDSVLRSENVA
jgi:hypothetical protein